MKPENKKRVVISYIVIVLLLLFVNLVLPRINIKEYSFDVFPSNLVSAGEKKSITDGTAGYLAFGPYIGCDRGKLRIEVFYTADSAGNTVDIYSNQNDRAFAKLELPINHHSVTLDADLPDDVTDMEFRVYYSGQGTLELDKVLVSERMTDLNIIILIYNIILVAVGIVIAVFAIKKKGSRK
ncbi:MAG: hypothetical protein J1F03_03870 [Oscillospiraceae bacterium]|nr:hypothetical protein [Oscillospiraceae bacterium]